MIYRLTGGLFIVVAVALALYAGQDFFNRKKDAWASASPAQRISLIVENDIRGLARAKELPEEWQSISKVTYIFESSLTKVLMNDQRPSVKIAKKQKTSESQNTNSNQDKKTDGAAKDPKAAAADKPKEYELEIDVLDVPDEENPGFIFQMSLLETGTKNKIYELGRTYHWSTLNLKNLDEKKPD